MWKKTIKLDRKQNNKDCGKPKQNCKTLSKIKCIQIFYKNVLYGPLLGDVREMSTIEMSVLKGDVNCDLKIMSTIERCSRLPQMYSSFWSIVCPCDQLMIIQWDSLDRNILLTSLQSKGWFCFRIYLVKFGKDFFRL